MSKEDNSGIVAIGLVVLLVFGLINMFGVYTMQSGVTLKEVQDEVAKIKMPTAAEIAALVPPVDIPEFNVPEFKDHEMMKDLWEDMYSDEIKYVEEKAEDEVDFYMDDMNIFESDEYDEMVDWFKGLVEGSYFEDDKNFSYSYVSKDCDIEVMELGLDDDEDSVAKVVCEFEVEHNLVGESNNHNFDKDVVFTFDVVLEETEFDEGIDDFDFDDSEVEVSYALAE